MQVVIDEDFEKDDRKNCNDDNSHKRGHKTFINSA